MNTIEPLNTSEPQIIDVIKIIPLNRSATQIQKMNRTIRTRRIDTDRYYQEQISREFDDNVTRTRNEERQSELDLVIGLDQILLQEQVAITNRNAAITRIQSVVRNHNVLNETMNRAHTKKQ